MQAQQKPIYRNSLGFLERQHSIKKEKYYKWAWTNIRILGLRRTRWLWGNIVLDFQICLLVPGAWADDISALHCYVWNLKSLFIKNPVFLFKHWFDYLLVECVNKWTISPGEVRLDGQGYETEKAKELDGQGSGGSTKCPAGKPTLSSPMVQGLFADQFPRD